MMRALTLTQPYATLVALGMKKIETRSWSTSYRGPLAIHAAAGYGKGGARGHKALCGTEPFCSVLNAACKAHYDALDSSGGILRAMAELPFMPMGAIVATCELIDCLPVDRILNGDWILSGTRTVPLSYQERMFGRYGGEEKRYAWLLANIQPLDTPRAAKGALGLWEWAS